MSESNEQFVNAGIREVVSILEHHGFVVRSSYDGGHADLAPRLDNPGYLVVQVPRILDAVKEADRLYQLLKQMGVKVGSISLDDLTTLDDDRTFVMLNYTPAVPDEITIDVYPINDLMLRPKKELAN